MTVEEVAQRLRLSESYVRRQFVAAWHGRQHDPRVPRVTLARTGRRGHPPYEVERASFERWLIPQRGM